MTGELAFHRGLDPIFAILTAGQIEALASLGTDESIEDEIAGLAAKANEGELSCPERAIYEAYIDANNFVAILKAEAMHRASTSGTASR